MNSSKTSTGIRYALVFVFWFFQANASGTIATSLEDCQKLLEKGMKEMDNNNFALALELLTKAEVLAKENQWKEQLCKIKGNIGISYSEMSNFGEALGYFKEALDLAKNIPKLNSYSITIYINIRHSIFPGERIQNRIGILSKIA